MELQDRQNIVERSLSSNEYGRNVSNALCRASIVMLVSHFEGFLKALLTYFVDAIIQLRPPVRNLSDNLLELMCGPLVKKIATASEGELALVLRRSLPHYSRMWQPDITASDRFIKVDLLTRCLTSAQPESIDLAFAKIGLHDIISKATSILSNSPDLTDNGTVRLDLTKELTRLVEQRNAIAHGDKTLKPTPVEVEAAIRLLDQAAGVMNSSLVAHTQDTCSLH